MTKRKKEGREIRRVELEKPREKWFAVSKTAEKSGEVYFENMVDKLSQQKPDSVWLKSKTGYEKLLLFEETWL